MESTQNENKISEMESSCWKRLSEWIHCICVVTFDLELGQAMEVRLRDLTFSTKPTNLNALLSGNISTKCRAIGKRKIEYLLFSVS